MLKIVAHIELIIAGSCIFPGSKTKRRGGASRTLNQLCYVDAPVR